MSRIQQAFRHSSTHCAQTNIAQVSHKSTSNRIFLTTKGYTRSNCLSIFMGACPEHFWAFVLLASYFAYSIDGDEWSIFGGREKFVYHSQKEDSMPENPSTPIIPIDEQIIDFYGDKITAVVIPVGRYGYICAP